MITSKTIAFSSLAVAGLFISAGTSTALADTEIVISGNGYRSDNEINIDTQNTTRLVQTNNADFDNNVQVFANTGANRVQGGRYGDSSIDTGDIDTRIEIENRANTNIANIEGCGGCNDDLRVLIHGNGAKSDNRIDIEKTNTIDVRQDNDARINNDVVVAANTGANQSSGSNWNKDYDSKYSDHKEDYKKYDKDHKYDDGKRYDHNTYSKFDDHRKYDDGKKDYDKKFYSSRYDFDKYRKDDKKKYDDKKYSKYVDFHKKDYDKKDYDHKDYGKKYDYDKDKKFARYSDYDKDHKKKYDDKDYGKKKYFDFARYFNKDDKKKRYFDWDWWRNNYGRGGDTRISTGDVSTDIALRNFANANYLSL